MTTNDITLWVQAGAVVVAIGASIVALIISALDRKNASQIAAEDRRTALEHGQLLFEQQALLRLLQNLRRGGHTDPAISKDMGAEAGAIIGALGPERLPMNWDKQVAKTDQELRAFVGDMTEPEWVRRSVEAQIALNAVTQQIRRRLDSSERS